MIRKTLLTLTLLWMQAAALQAQVALTERASARTDFELVAADSGAAVCYDAGDAAVVETAAGLFAADVARVTGREIPVVAGQEFPAKTRCAVIVGTIGQSRWIDELIAAKKIDVSAIEGGWERYAIRLVERPGHGVRKALVIAGSEKKGTVITEAEKRIIAYHEVGHALVAAKQKNAQPVSKITIVPHTQGALGYTLHLPEEEKFLMSREDILTEIRTLLAGRSSEEVVCNTMTSGAANDIERATEMARNLVAR